MHMNKLTISTLFALLIFIAINCKINNTKATFKVEKQLTARTFGKTISLCSDEIILNNDYTYCKERGCENHSSVNLGTWSQVGDSIYLVQYNPSTFNFIKSYKVTGTQRDSVVFKITDKFGSPLRRFVIVSYPYNPTFIFDERSDFTLKNISRNDKELEWELEMSRVYENHLAKESNIGEFVISRKDIEFFELTSLFLLSNKRLQYKPIDIEGDTVEIQLTINKEAVFHSDLEWNNMKSPLSFKLKDSILSIDDFILIERK